VPEVLPPDMISFAKPEEHDVVRAVSEAVHIVSQGQHDPIAAHSRIRTFYNWEDVAERTENVYRAIKETEPIDLYTRMRRCLGLGPVFGLIHVIIFAVDCMFFAVLDVMYPRDKIHYVEDMWNEETDQENVAM